MPGAVGMRARRRTALLATAVAGVFLVAPWASSWSARLLAAAALLITASYVAAAREASPRWRRTWGLFAAWAAITAGGALLHLLGVSAHDPALSAISLIATLPALLALGLILRHLYDHERLFPAFLDGWLFVGSLPALAVGMFAVPPIPWDDLTEPRFAFAAGTVALDLVLLSLIGGVGISVRGGIRFRAGFTATGVALLGLAHTLGLRDLLGAPVSPMTEELATAMALLILAAVPWVGAGQPPPAEERRRRSVSGATYPYVVAFLALASVATWLLVDGAVDFGLLMLGLSLVVALVLRQALTVQDNVRLLRELRAREDHFRSLVIGSSDVIVVVDQDGSIGYVSPAVERQFGYLVDELLGAPLTAIVHPEDVAAVTTATARAFAGHGTPARLAARIADATGVWRNTESTLSARQRDVVINLRDVSDRVALTAQMERLAYHDPLTGLANRARFTACVEEAVTAPEPGWVGVLFLDLDGFKSVNDTAGHEAGDRVLTEAATRLATSIGPHDVASRWGGDEFAVLVARRPSTSDVQAVAAQVLRALSAPHHVGVREYAAGASIGVAWAAGMSDASALMRNADLAMYRAKQRGKGRVEVFRPRLLQIALDRADSESRIVRALEDRSIAVGYQPIVALDGRRIVGVETLLRWTDSDGLPGSPEDLIRYAEQSGHIDELGAWAIEQALADSTAWRTRGVHLDIAVNLSARQIAAPGIVSTVQRLLSAAGVPPRELTLEITESVLVEDRLEIMQRLGELRGLGLRLVLDDFGTGYSSLAYLSRLPVDGLKLDRSFVAGLGFDPGSDALVRSMVRLGHELGLLVTAEGVETDEQADRLERLGCPRGQGFLFSPALTRDELVAMLDTFEGQSAISDGETLPVQA